MSANRRWRVSRRAEIRRAASGLEPGRARTLCAKLATRADWNDPAVQELLRDNLGVDVADRSAEPIIGQLELPLGAGAGDVQR